MDRSKSFRAKNGVSLDDVSWLGYTGNDLTESFSDEGDLVIRTIDLGGGTQSQLLLKKIGRYVRLLDAQHELNAGVPPTATDDANSGYSVSSIWVDIAHNMAYICVNATVNAAVWLEVGGTGGGGGTVLEYPYTDVGEPTGFTKPGSVTIRHNVNDRTITLLGVVKALFRGVVIPELTGNWVSPQYPDTTDIVYYCYYSSFTNSIIWSVDLWGDDDLPIASVVRGVVTVCLRECHGFMDQRTHRVIHKVIGTVVDSGLLWINGSYVLGSTVPTDRRPTLTSGVIYDEDVPTFIAGTLGVNDYTHIRMTGASTVNEYLDQSEILAVSGSIPFWNQKVGGVWQQTPMGVHTYSKGFVVALPVAQDEDSQKRRLLWIQPQNNSQDLTEIRATRTNTIDLGNFVTSLREIVFVGEYIVRYTATNWSIIAINTLDGSGASQLAKPVVYPSNKEVCKQYLKNFASMSQLPNWSDSAPQIPDFYGYPTWSNGGYQSGMANARGAIVLPFNANRVSYSGKLRLHRIDSGTQPAGTAVAGTIHIVRTNATNASVVATFPIMIYTAETLNQGQAQQPNNPSTFWGDSFFVTPIPVGDYIGVSLTLDSLAWGVIGDVSLSINLRVE